jgi:hypothetical protein
MLFIDCLKILMSNVTLNVADSVYFDSLNLSSSSTGQFTTSGNFSYIQNTPTNIYPNTSTCEYGTICIGPIQIKFGYVGPSGGENNVTFTNYFPTAPIMAIGSAYGGTSVEVGGIGTGGVTFYNGGGSGPPNVFWIAIGH